MGNNNIAQQIAQAAQATTPNRGTPQFGLAYDLGSGQWVSQKQFASFVRDQVTQQAAQVPGPDPKIHDQELASASNFQNHGLFVSQMPDLGAQQDDSGHGFGSFLSAINPISIGEGVAGQAMNLFHAAGGAVNTLIGNEHQLIADNTGIAVPTFDSYKAKGGTLTEAEWNSFNDATKTQLFSHANMIANLGSFSKTPGVNQALTGITDAYRGLTTGGIMLGHVTDAIGTDIGMTFHGDFWHGAPVAREWTSPTAWNKAWQESNDESFGNSLVDAVLNPFTTHEQLDAIRKHSALYDLASFGTEALATWYVDPLTNVSRAAKAGVRLQRGEMPVEGGSLYNTAFQTRAGMPITTKNPATKALGQLYGKSVLAKQDRLSELATHMPLEQYANLAPFRLRQTGGQAAAAALHFAANSGDGRLTDAVWGYINHRPDAVAYIESLRKEVPETLKRIAPGAQSVLDSIDSAKSYFKTLQDEVDKLNEVGIEPSGDATYDWTLHTAAAQKQVELGVVKDALAKYDGYNAFLERLGNTATPALDRSGPSILDRVQRHMFVDNQYGSAHSSYEISRSLYLKRAGMVDMHDLDSGATALQQQWNQLEHFGYSNPEARDATLHAWFNADTPTERWNVVDNFERTHVINALSQELGVHRDLIEGIYKKVITEQNRMKATMQAGKGSQYMAGDNTSNMIVGDTNPDGSINVELLENGRHLVNIKAPAESLEPKGPIDPTQTPNYYQPIDYRAFRLTLKREDPILQEMHTGYTLAAAKGKADAMKAIDAAGQKFNSMWKPLQLFRLGWAQRVLMDENARALAILGPIRVAREYGPEYLDGAYNLLRADRWAPALAKRWHLKNKLPLGPGPISDAVKWGHSSSENPFIKDAQLARVPMTPERFRPELNTKRLDKISDVVGEHYNWQRSLWGNREANLPNRPEHPLDRAVEDFQNATGKQRPHKAYDPVSGNQINSGYVIPLPHTAFNLKSANGTPESWYSQNARLLASKGYRVVVTPTGRMMVGRYFPTYLKDQAHNFLDSIESDTRHSMHNLADRTEVWRSDPAEASPAVSDLARIFSERAGDAPLGRGKVGRTLYTYTDRPASYTIKHSRLGSRKTFDLDRETTGSQRQAFQRYATENAMGLKLSQDEMARLTAALEGDGTWSNIFDRLDSTNQREALVNFFEKYHGASALKYESNGQHVTAWVEPESLSVMRKGATNAKMRPLEEHLQRPTSTERLLPDKEGEASKAEQEARLTQAHAMNAEFNDDARMQQIMAAKEQAAANEAALSEAINSPLSWLKRKFTRTYNIQRSADGKKIEFDKAFTGNMGAMLYSQTGSAGTMDALTDGNRRALTMLRRQAVGMKTYHPPTDFSPGSKIFQKGSPEQNDAIQYFGRWAEMLNSQVAHSPIWRRMLDGKMSDDDIVHWLDTTPAGYQVKHEIMPGFAEGTPTELWVNQHRALLDHYLPNYELRRRLLKNNLTPDDLRAKINPSDLPDVFGPDFDAIDNRSRYRKFIQSATDDLWEGLGSIPTDKLSRHPFAKSMYDLRMRSLIASHNSEWITDEKIQEFTKEARNFALTQTKRYLWDLSDTTNFTTAIRFMAPFWNAQQEALTKWLRIVLERPETVGRFFAGQNAMYQNFAVIDQNGQPVNRKARQQVEAAGGYVPPGQQDRGYIFYHPSDRVIFPVLGAMRMLPGIGKALETVGGIGIPLSSANTVLQGDYPLLPGLGPMMTMPMDQFLYSMNDAHGTNYAKNFWYKYFFPIGRPAHMGALSGALHGDVKPALDQLDPSWIKRVVTASSSVDDVTKASTYTIVNAEMTLRNREEGKPPPTPGEVASQVQWFMALRTLAGLVSPVQLELRPGHQMWIDAMHQFQQSGDPNWFDKFFAKYGEDAAIYASSATVGPDGKAAPVAPTVLGQEGFLENKDLISKYPGWAGAILSPDVYKDTYNSDAYHAQFDMPISPDSPNTLRQTATPQQRLEQAESRIGWIYFRQIDNAVNAKLADAGLHSVSQRGAEQLAAWRHDQIVALATKYPAWYADYMGLGTSVYQSADGRKGEYAKIDDLEKLAFGPGHERFDNRPDWQGVRQYLMIRDQVVQRLDRYGASGGSPSLQAQENSNLRNWFYDQVGQLVLANPSFADFYARYLSQDKLDQGSGIGGTWVSPQTLDPTATLNGGQ